MGGGRTEEIPVVWLLEACKNPDENFCEDALFLEYRDQFIFGMRKDGKVLYTLYDYERLLELKLALDSIMERLS